MFWKKGRVKATASPETRDSLENCLQSIGRKEFSQAKTFIPDRLSPRTNPFHTYFLMMSLECSLGLSLKDEARRKLERILTGDGLYHLTEDEKKYMRHVAFVRCSESDLGFDLDEIFDVQEFSTIKMRKVQPLIKQVYPLSHSGF